MIPSIIAELEQAHRKLGLSWRQLCAGVSYPTLMRWKQRLRSGQPPVLKPGPKKTQSLGPDFFQELEQLPHGRCRTQGTTQLHQQFSSSVSRRQLRALARQIRQHHLYSMTRIHWLRPNLAWASDATNYGGSKIIPLYDLASRYRIDAFVAPNEEGSQIARFLEAAFQQHGPPLFFKRDNGSPFNCHEVDHILAKYWVLSLNNPPAYPRYNGAMEKSIRDLKAALSQRALPPAATAPHLALQLEASLHHLNHKPSRCLNGRTPCHCFHDPKRRLPLNRKTRKLIFRLLYLRYSQTIQAMSINRPHQLHKAWRITVQSWLQQQNLIAITTNKNKKQTNQNQNVSTIFPKKWSQN